MRRNVFVRETSHLVAHGVTWAALILLGLVSTGFSTTLNNTPEPNAPLRPYRLLFINSPVVTHPWHEELFRACRDNFESLTGRPVQVQVERLGISFVDNPGFREATLTRLRSLYTDEVDFILMRGPVLRFLQAEELLPGVPVIIPSLQPQDLKADVGLPPNVFAFRVHTTPVPCAELALQVYPQAQKLIVVSGLSHLGRRFREQMQEACGNRIQAVPVEYWNGLPLAELKQRVATLPADHLLLLLYMKLDRDGTPYQQEAVTQTISKNASVPLFSFVDGHMTKGALGGYVCSSRLNGQRAAQLMARLARGESPSAMTEVYDFGEKQFDWFQMKRWGLRADRLPADALILNRPDSFFGRHPWIQPLLRSAFMLLILSTLIGLWYVRVRTRFLKRIEEYHHRLKALTSELTLAEERLKRQVATQLHDQICQSLALSRTRVTALQQSHIESQTKTSLAQIQAELDTALENTRHITRKLSYPTLNVLGLDKAVERWLQEEVQGKQDIQTELKVTGQGSRISLDLRALLFRGFRELVTNTLKHAQATKLTVTIHHSEVQTSITVEDDGIGYKQDSQTKTGGFGLLSVQEALETLGGCLTIQTKPGSGCRVTMQVKTAPIPIATTKHSAFTPQPHHLAPKETL